MGGRSKSSTSTTTQTTTQNLNLQGVAAPTVVGDGSITVTDQGAVQAAFEAIDRTQAEQQKTLREGNQVLASAVTRAVSESFQFANRVQDKAYAFAADAARSEVAKGFDTLIKWSTGAASVAALAWILNKGE